MKYLNQFFLLLHSYGFDTQRFLDATLATLKIKQRNLDAITALRLGAAEMGPDMKKGEAAAFVMAVWPDKQDTQPTSNPHNIVCLFTTTIRMIKAARDHKTIPIDLCAPCTSATNNDESVDKITKPFKATFAHLSSLFKRMNLRTDHPFMLSILTLTRKKGFLTNLVTTKKQAGSVKWAREDLPEVIRAVWTIGASKVVLLERFESEKDALNWLSSEGCGPSCALTSSTGDGGLSYQVKGLQSLDCQCVGSYLGRQEPAYNDENALGVAAKETAAWKLFNLVQKVSTVPGSMKPKDGVMTSQLGVLGADENGGVTLNKQQFMILTEGFLDQINAAKKQGKEDGRKWIDKEYLTEKWNKNNTMVQKATLIARCMVAFHWMCQTHHVQYEGFNDYHGRRQHVVRKEAGKLIHEKMKVRWEKKKGNNYDDLKNKGEVNVYDALKDKGEVKKLKKQKSMKVDRRTRGTLSLTGKTKKRGAEAKTASPVKKAKTPPAKKAQKSKKKSIGGKKGRN
ncbi:hypothetical protein TrRE_jg660 [Triparma retinervis]|uniref:Uncharacterized protein n=1 Tax=Triparma retinervis TaxID=2557542 RepID=A0A9W6ZLG1_9STRA|nr:hypothetical protein TrRE_jg660 [Triparma retinervis]